MRLYARSYPCMLLYQPPIPHLTRRKASPTNLRRCSSFRTRVERSDVERRDFLHRTHTPSKISFRTPDTSDHLTTLLSHRLCYFTPSLPSSLLFFLFSSLRRRRRRRRDKNRRQTRRSITRAATENKHIAELGRNKPQQGGR